MNQGVFWSFCFVYNVIMGGKLIRQTLQTWMWSRAERDIEELDKRMCSESCKGWKEWEYNIIEYSQSIQGEYTFIHTCKSQHIVFCRQSEGNFIYRQWEPIRSFSSASRVHVWVCPWVCLSILWPAESAMPELICYTANVIRSPEHLVTLLSCEILSLRSLAGSRRATACARQWELSQSVCFNRPK